MNLIDELNQVIASLPLNRKPARQNIAYFCEHDGIYIRFTRARSTWHAMAPCALKPWWLFLNPLRNNSNQDKIIKNTAAAETTEVTDNA